MYALSKGGTWTCYFYLMEERSFVSKTFQTKIKFYINIINWIKRNKYPNIKFCHHLTHTHTIIFHKRFHQKLGWKTHELQNGNVKEVLKQTFPFRSFTKVFLSHRKQSQERFHKHNFTKICSRSLYSRFLTKVIFRMHLYIYFRHICWSNWSIIISVDFKITKKKPQKIV